MITSLIHKNTLSPSIQIMMENHKKLIDELVILDDCVVTGTFKWRSEIDPNWTPRVWNETFECWTKDYCG